MSSNVGFSEITLHHTMFGPEGSPVGIDRQNGDGQNSTIIQETEGFPLMASGGEGNDTIRQTATGNRPYVVAQGGPGFDSIYQSGYNSYLVAFSNQAHPGQNGVVPAVVPDFNDPSNDRITQQGDACVMSATGDNGSDEVRQSGNGSHMYAATYGGSDLIIQEGNSAMSADGGADNDTIIQRGINPFTNFDSYNIAIGGPGNDITDQQGDYTKWVAQGNEGNDLHIVRESRGAILIIDGGSGNNTLQLFGNPEDYQSYAGEPGSGVQTTYINNAVVPPTRIDVTNIQNVQYEGNP